MFVIVYEDQSKDSTIRIYNTKDALQWGNKEGNGPQCVKEIKAPRDHVINCVKWGALD